MRLAHFARVRLLRHTLSFFTVFKKKPTVLQSSSCLTIVIGIIFELNPFPACTNRGNAVFI